MFQTQPSIEGRARHFFSKVSEKLEKAIAWGALSFGLVGGTTAFIVLVLVDNNLVIFHLQLDWGKSWLFFGGPAATLLFTVGITIPKDIGLWGVLRFLWHWCGVWFFRDLLWYSILGYASKKTLDLLRIQRLATHTSLSDRYFHFSHLFRRKKTLYIIYSDRPESKEEPAIEVEYASFPIDEAGFIMRTWALATYYLHWENVVLKSYSQYLQLTDVEKESIKKGNLILIGSSSYNKVVKSVLDKAREDEKASYFFTDPQECDIFKKEKGANVKVFIEKPPSPQKKWGPTKDKVNDESGPEYYDYALVSRLANPFDSNNTVFIFGGCTRAAQYALTEWFYDPKVLQNLCERFRNSPFELIMGVKCDWKKSKVGEELTPVGQARVIEPPKFKGIF